MTATEKRWAFLDWTEGREIDELCEEYDCDEATVYAAIKEQLGIRTDNNQERLAS